jgi:hypothetical protein
MAVYFSTLLLGGGLLEHVVLIGHGGPFFVLQKRLNWKKLLKNRRIYGNFTEI